MAKDSLADALIAAIGKNDDHQEPAAWLDTGFAPLNHAISGSYTRGLPSGRIIEIFGPESSGKTAIATNVMASAQKNGGIAGFCDHERSFFVDLAESFGLDTSPGRFVFKTPETFEKSVTFAIKAAQIVREKALIDPKAPIAWVFDSLASMVPMSKAGKEVTEYNMNDTTALARATSSVFPSLAQYCEQLNMCAMFLNQVRLKPGVVYGNPETTPGGNAPRFYSSVRIQLGRAMLSKGEGEAKQIVGQEITAKCIKNKVHRPFMKAKWRFLFREDGVGYFDVTGSMIDYLIDIKRLTISGARVTWIDGKQYFKSQLVEKIEKEGLQAELTKLLPSDEAAPELEVPDPKGD